nr:hypothetical protein [Tanacetum cinerariifolium]
MTTLADKAILSGADDRPPMLEKDMYDSWKSRMELYMMNTQHGRMILESVENGPLLWPTIEKNRVTRPKKYSDLSATEAIQADCDVKATDVILQGLPLEDTCQSNAQSQRGKWDEALFKDKNSDFPAQHDALILPVIEQLKTQVVNCTKINNDNKSVNETLTVELERYKDQVRILKEGNNVDKASDLCAHSMEIDNLKQTLSEHLNEKESLKQMLTFLKNDFQKEEPRNIDKELSLEKQDTCQSNAQSQRGKWDEALFKDKNSDFPAQHDALILPVIEQLKTQVVNCTKINNDNKSVNETLTVELERYKDQVRILKEGNNVDKASDLCAHSMEIDNLKQTLSEHLNEKESLKQMLTFLKNDFQKEEPRNIDKELSLEKQVKELNNIVFKRNQSAQTVHMLTKP